MKTKITKPLFVLLTLITPWISSDYLKAQNVYNFGASKKEGYQVAQQTNKSILINYSVSQLTTEERIIEGSVKQNISLSGVFLPNEAGAPDLPSSQRYIAIPQGAKAILKIVSVETETLPNMEIAPAPVIPLDEIDKIGEPMVYKMNDAIYSKNALYPEQPVILSESMQLRGIDVVSLGISPFQYNPVTKDLIVYKNMTIEISYEGGSTHFGEDAYRSRWWNPILEDVIMNYNQLPDIDYNTRLQKAMEEQSLTSVDEGCEYAIIIPTNPEFAVWADSIKKFRTEQGIYTKVYKLSDIGGNTVAAIKSWVTDAYKNWKIKPAAMLLLGDYGTNAASTVISTKTPGFASDNYYSDVTGDNLPDIAFSRIMANNEAQLKVMCTKFLNYERNPPTDASFYDKAVSSTGWQDDRWYQLGVEITGGFLKSINKHPIRINNPSSPANNTGNNTAGAGSWSTTNATTIVNYFGDSGLKYIPNKPGTLGGFSGGTAAQINTAINEGTFIAFHRDHGQYTGWYRPSYQSTNLTSLTNVNNKLPFVFSINCNTGEYQTGSECFAEKFHRSTYNGQNSGALGVIAPSEVSYSFVNDVFLWGIMDNMWPSFMPAMGTTPASRDMRPTFASVAGQYFLAQSSWVGSESKKVTYQLYHTFAESFQWFYSEVPKNLTVVHASSLTPGASTFTVQADAGAFIALTTTSPTGPVILGTATGTGAPLNITLANSAATQLLVTVTKQNYFRYSRWVGVTTGVADVTIDQAQFSCFPNPFSGSTTFYYSLNGSGAVNLSVYNMLGEKVATVIDEVQSSGKQEVEFNNKVLAAGVYTCRLITPNGLTTKQIVINK
jgi:hypothetical protein